MKASVLFILGSVAAHAGSAHTLCLKGEVDYFTCTLKNSKVISVCGSESLVPTEESGASPWLQYREAIPKKKLTTFPITKKNSVSFFEGNYFAPHDEDHQVSDLRFIQGNSLYSVSIDYGKSISANLSIELNGKAHLYPCQSPINRYYWSKFTALESVLGRANGRTDIFYEYHRRISKK
jgi:hypothetical protein